MGVNHMHHVLLHAWCVNVAFAFMSAGPLCKLVSQSTQIGILIMLYDLMPECNIWPDARRSSGANSLQTASEHGKDETTLYGTGRYMQFVDSVCFRERHDVT